MMAQIATFLADEFVVYAAKSYVIFEMVWADLTLLSLAISWMLFARLTFFGNIHLILRDLSHWHVLMRKILVNLADIRRTVWSYISHIVNWVTTIILDDLVMVGRKSKHGSWDSTCCSKAIIPSLESWILIGVIARWPHSYMVGGRALCLLRHLYLLSIVLRLLHCVSSRWVNFSLKDAIALSDILRTATIIEISILLVNLISSRDSWGISNDLFALSDLVCSKLSWIPLLLWLALVLVLTNNWNVIWILGRWWHFQ